MKFVIDDAAYVGSIPDKYHHGIGPFLCEPYAQHIALRMKELAPSRVLETACGTGILTRRLREAMPSDALLVASDLNPPMLAVARRTLGRAAIELVQADMRKLHFADNAFDAAVCHFGLMCVADKPAAVREARRVLQPGGSLVLTTWAALDRNPIIGIVHRTITGLFPDNPPQYLKRVVFGLGEPRGLTDLLVGGGFRNVEVNLVEKTAVSRGAHELAEGLVEGCPLVEEIRLRDPARVPAVVEAVTRAIVRQFGDKPVKTRVAALIACGVT
jgi:SAM-dependent methyltransferase